jgi:methylated-DNA-[protein]-cysteine S-methyltransferase
MKQYLLNSKIGPLYFVATDSALRGIFWKKQDAPFIQSIKECDVLEGAVRQVEEYLAGERSKFDLTLEPIGTDFQMKVWRELARIPYGATISYTELARRIRNEKAVRAVGTANGRNPLSLVIPCHRVIAADGSLGGYAGGLEIKRKLLELEKKPGSWKK